MVQGMPLRHSDLFFRMNNRELYGLQRNNINIKSRKVESISVCFKTGCLRLPVPGYLRNLCFSFEILIDCDITEYIFLPNNLVLFISKQNRVLEKL